MMARALLALRPAAIGALAIGALAIGALAAGCDNRQAIHRLDPHLNRMLEQPRLEPYDESTLFEDGKAMRAPPPGTVPHDRLRTDKPALTAELLAEGRRHFDTICAACHGIDGSGESVVATKMAYRPPPAFDEPRVSALSDDDVYRIVSTGYGLMPGYAFMLSPHDRWAIIGYVKALRLHRRAPVAVLPPAVQARLRESAP